MSKKNVVVFASTGESEIYPKQQTAIDLSLPSEIRRKIKYFPLPGAYDYSKLDFKDKFLMNFGPIRKLRFDVWLNKDEKSKKQLAFLHKTVDWNRKEAVVPILDFVNDELGGEL